MDTKGIIQEHSKIKLELYRLYLELYLTVLLNSRRFKKVFVHDIFAGSGKSVNDENGSPLVAAVEIQKIRNKFPNIPVILQLNEKCPDKFARLQELLKPFAFRQLFNLDANDYIQQWSLPSDSHNLFFIDPHGYTQVSTENLKRLFSTQYCDFLIFIPIYHIYRFLKPSEDAAYNMQTDFLSELGIEKSPANKAGSDKYYEPIARFLSGLGIEEAHAKSTNTVEEFSILVADALKRISGSEYVYIQLLENKASNSKYCLFFISNHILGAEKFLDAQKELKAKITQNAGQQFFDFVTNADTESILNFTVYDHPYDNVSLYEHGVKHGIRPSEIKNELKKLENSDKVIITELPGKKRQRKGFYIDYMHYKETDRIISITFKR